MIEELSIAHYKSVFDCTSGLNRANVFVGKNGSGKSNVVDALTFLSDIASEDLDYAMTKRHGVDSVRQYSKFKPYHVTIAVKVRNKEGFGQYKLSFSSSRNSYRVLEEVLEWTGETALSDDVSHSVLVRGPNGSIEVETDSKDADLEESEANSERLESGETLLHRTGSRYMDMYWLVIYLHSELRSLSAYSIFPNTIRAPQVVSRSAQLESDGGNIASILKQLTPDRRRRLVKNLRAVMPNLINISTRSAAGYYVPSFTVKDKISDEVHELNMSQISDGTLRILGILVALYQNNTPSKIILEEPEQMIHPALLVIVKDALDNYLDEKKNGQVFITTHSSIFMDLFEVSDVIAVENDGHSTRFGSVSSRQKEVVRNGLMSLGDVLIAEGLEVA